MKFKQLIVMACGLGLVSWTFAAGGGGGDEGPSSSSWNSAVPEDPAVKAARAALGAGDYASAQTMLKVALAGKPGDAELNNLYAYSLRKGANPDMATVFKYYNEALRIDPKNRNANEYIGEAYLMVDNPAKAKEHLAALDKLCFFGCEQYTDLKKAIAAYEVKMKK